MKKNTKKRRTIRRLLIATAFALLMIPASVSADVVGKKITQKYTPNKQNPLSKIEYTYRSDGKTVHAPKKPEAPNPTFWKA